MAKFVLKYTSLVEGAHPTNMPKDQVFEGDEVLHTFTIPNQVPQDSNWIFHMWTTDVAGGDFYEPGDNFTVSPGETTLYATWFKKELRDFKVIFDDNGGSGGPSDLSYRGYEWSHEFTIPSRTPTKPGTEFTVWTDITPGYIGDYHPGDTIIVNEGRPRTLQAHWTMQGFHHVLEYNMNGGQGGPSNQEKWEPIELAEFSISSTIPTRQGYDFLGWSDSKTATKASYTYGDTVYVSGSRVLYAVWSPKKYTYTLAFNANGGQGAPGEMSTVDTVTAVSFRIPDTIPTWDKHRFRYWTANPQGGGQPYHPGGSVMVGRNAKLTLYAQWEKDNEFYVTFDANGGVGAPADMSHVGPESMWDVTIPKDVPTYEGYLFEGWLYNVSPTVGQTVQPGETVSVKPGTTVFTAQWKEILYSFDLQFDTLGGTGGPAPQHIDSSETIHNFVITEEAPKKPDYDFLGWTLTKDGTGRIYTAGEVIPVGRGAIATLYAKWKLTEYTYTLAFNANGGEGEPSAVVVTDTVTSVSIEIPAGTPTWTKHKFLGWTDNSAGSGTVYTAGMAYPVTRGSTVILYAKWKKYNDFTVRFDAMGGTGAPEAMTYSGPEDQWNVRLPDTVPTRTEFTFDGWAVPIGGSAAQIVQPGTTISVNPGVTTVSAEWKAILYAFDLVFDTLGGEGGPEPQHAESTEKVHNFVITEDIPTKKGFTFLGWTRDIGGAGELLTPGRVVVVERGVITTLYAKWQAQAESIQFKNAPKQMFAEELNPCEVIVLPQTSSDKRVRFDLEPADCASTIESTQETADGGICDIRAAGQEVITVVATSMAVPTVSARHRIIVDRKPVTHGTADEPLTEVIGSIEDYKADTLYIRKDAIVELAGVTQTGRTIHAIGISPLDSGIRIDSNGGLTGSAAKSGEYTVTVMQMEDGTEVSYRMTIHIVGTGVVLVTEIIPDGPDTVEVGQRVELYVTTKPADATDPYVRITAYDNRVRIVNPTGMPGGLSVCWIEGRLEGMTHIRLASMDGAVSLDYPIRVVSSTPTGDSWVMDAGAGRFPNGLSEVSGPVDDGYYLPDWSVVDRPGYRLSGWSGSDGTQGAMGQFSKAGVTWTAQWVEDRRGYSTEYLPRAAVRIYRTLDQYIDLTEMYAESGEPVISMAENRPESAVLSVVNDYSTPTMHVLGEGCTLWSSGPAGPIATGMYCRVEDIRPDGTVRPLLDGFVTTLAPDADAGMVTLTIGDRKAVLSRSGTSIRRNYYKGRAADTRVDAGYETGELYGDLTSLPSDAQVEPPYKWAVGVPKSYPSTGLLVLRDMRPTKGEFWTLHMPEQDGLDVIRTVRIHASMDVKGSSVEREYTSHGQLYIRSQAGTFSKAYTQRFTSKQGNFDFTFNFEGSASSGIPISGPLMMWLTTDIEKFTPMDTYHLDFEKYEDDRCSLTYYSYVNQAVQTVPSGISMDIDGFAWTPCDAHRENNKMVVDAIEGVTDLNAPALREPSKGRMRVSFLAEDISTVQVMAGVSLAVGSYPLPNDAALQQQETMLKVFRTGGGYAQDYLQKLADIPSRDRRMRAFRSRGYRTPVVMMGARYRLEDAPRAIFAYGSEIIPGAQVPVIHFHAFTPNMTMKNRPSLVMVRGTGTTFSGQTLPLMVAVEDIASREHRGISVEQVLTDSSINSPLGAARAGYAQVSASDLDRWEGTVVLPEIHTELMELDGPYVGSGVPVELYDYRNGLKAYKARVKEVKLDYVRCTTTVTLVNYSLVYSSSLGDGVATAITAADVATGASDNSLYATQYVRVVADLTQPVDRTAKMNHVTLILGDGQRTVVDGVTFLDFPGGRTVLVAIAPPDGKGHTDGTRPYDVVAVQVNNGSEIPIPKPLRPDYYEGQTLIVNLDFPTI